MAATKKAKASIEVTETIQPIEATTETVAVETTVSEFQGVVIGDKMFPVTVPRIDTGTKDEITGYGKKLADGDVFTPAEIEAVIAYGRMLTAEAVAYKALSVEIIGEKQELFAPFAAFAESLCVDKNGLLILSGQNVKIETTNGGLLSASMIAVLDELTAGRAGSKAAKFTVRNARKAVTAEASGDSEEIEAVAIVSIIGRDKNGEMLRLIDKFHEATDKATDIAPNWPRVSALLESIASRQDIEPSTVKAILQAAVFGRHAATCSQLAKSCFTIQKDGARAVQA